MKSQIIITYFCRMMMTREKKMEDERCKEEKEFVRAQEARGTAAQLVEAETWITLGASFLAYCLAPFEDGVRLVFFSPRIRLDMDWR